MSIFGADVPFAEHCGIREIEFLDGRTRLRLLAVPSLSNNVGALHGGLVCTLLDVAMGSAARCSIGEPVVTLGMNVSFLAAANSDLTAEGRVVRSGGSVFFCEAEARDQTGALVAKSSGIFKRAGSKQD